MSVQTATVASSEKTLLIVEDDKPFLQRLASAMQTRGFAVTTVESVAEGLQQVEQAAPAFAVVDMRLGDRKSTRLNSSHIQKSRMPSSA